MQLSRRYPRRRAFITGAASGLGLAFSRHLASDAWTIGMADIDAASLADASTDVERAGGRPHCVELDVTDAEAVRAAADDFSAQHGGVDLLINNAGIGAGGPFAETTIDTWEQVLSVNLMGVVHGCKAFLPALLDNPDGGHILNVSSLAAIAAAPRMSAYNASKAGVRALSETLYGELKNEGIRVSVLLPGFFPTNIDANLRGPDSARKMTKKMMAKSDLSADDVARRALQEAGRDRIHILMTDWQSQLVWYFQRLLPGTYVRQLPGREADIRAAVDR